MAPRIRQAHPSRRRTRRRRVLVLMLLPPPLPLPLAPVTLPPPVRSLLVMRMWNLHATFVVVPKMKWKMRIWYLVLVATCDVEWGYRMLWFVRGARGAT